MIRYWTYRGLSLLHARYATHRFGPHFHDDFSIAVIVGGALQFTCGGDSHVAEPATISAVNPGEVHTGQPGVERGWEYLHFFIPPEALREFVPELRASVPDIRKPVIEDVGVARALIRAHKAAASETEDLQKDVLLTQAFASLFMNHADDRAELIKLGGRATTRRAEDYIRAHFSGKFKLADLAAEVGLSPYHFLRTFAADTGLTPYAYLQQVRVSYGLQRLKQGAASAEAANDAGYADQSHFIRAMKRTYGVTPSFVQRAA